jgi:flagellar hook-length control protein FliK
VARVEKSVQVKEPVAAAGNGQRAHPVTQPAAQPKAAAPKIHVVDLRRKAEAGRTAEDAAALVKNQQGLSVDRDASSSLSPRQVTMQDASGGLAFKQSSPVVPAGQTALERFRETAGNELVKATHMVLRDGGGEIRLVLKPESLGSVRIKMHLVDNAIEGKIVVDNQAVKQVIDGNLDSLMRALRAEGFQGATLQVSVGGQNADNGRQAQDDRPEALRRVTAQGFERNIPGVENLSMGDLLVNLFV